jgi:hypothetical protein
MGPCYQGQKTRSFLSHPDQILSQGEYEKLVKNPQKALLTKSTDISGTGCDTLNILTDSDSAYQGL